MEILDYNRDLLRRLPILDKAKRYDASRSVIEHDLCEAGVKKVVYYVVYPDMDKKGRVNLMWHDRSSGMFGSAPVDVDETHLPYRYTMNVKGSILPLTFDDWREVIYHADGARGRPWSPAKI